MEHILWQTEFPRLNPPKRGKVRDVYDLGDHLADRCDRQGVGLRRGVAYCNTG